ncbi:type II toxin-antitoxin system VapC family toxin [Iodidimonas sp. SYSU 1G8]|uniref:type II toxin-antitoxin system VapC family toxin n=1 Tax=Iodidimonas sp. SYSU 1G8 TaxID=3133967 RepID=UPI0031FECEDC
MERAVVDASVAIKWTIEENNSQEALHLAARTLLIAPHLMLTECGNILWRKARLGEITPQAAVDWHADLALVPVEYMDDHALLPKALALAVRLDHPVYDCLYVAASLECGAPLVTADARLHRKLLASGGLAVAPVLLSELKS